MRRPTRSPERRPDGPDVVDLNARRRVAELKKASQTNGRRPPGAPRLSGSLGAWALLILAAVLWALLRWLQT